MSNDSGWVRRLVVGGIALCVFSATSVASAEVEMKGSWPDLDRRVSVQVDDVSRTEALSRIASQMGWSVAAHDLPDGKISLSVHDQPVSKVLNQVLDSADYVARREGQLVTFSPALAAPSVGSTAKATEHEEQVDSDDDRVAFGGNVRVGPKESVDDVTVFGGNADVYGHVRKDVTVMGGKVVVHKGARIDGDASVLGGQLVLRDGSHVEGDVDAMGGKVIRGDQATVGGSVTKGEDINPTTLTVGAKVGESVLSLPERVWNGLGGALARALLMFVLGAMFLALAPQRMETLEVELARQPMRNLALGFLGALGTVVLSIALAVTIIGVPVSVLLMVGVPFVSLLASSAVVITAGEALLRHRTENRYVHLALGWAALSLIGLIPYVGTFVWVVVMSAGLGVVIATRGAGMFPSKGAPVVNQGPYRTNAV